MMASKSQTSTPPLKIFHFIDSGGLYGAEVMLINLAREQLEAGLQPVIGSVGDVSISEKALESAARKEGIPVKIFRMKPGLNVQGVKEILAYCHTHDFHLIHSHGYKGNIFFGFLPHRFRKIPVISTLHGWTSSSEFTKMRVYEWLDAQSLRFLDALVVVNKKMLQHSRLPNINKNKIFVVDNGIPEQRIKNAVLDQDIVDFCQDGFILGSIGRYSREKGYDVLLKVLCSLRTHGIRAKLLLVGEGPLRPELQALAKSLGIEKFVFFSGYREKAEGYMPLLDLYVISSFTEGLPITLLEAMREKVPVVATTVGGIPDVLEHKMDALLVPPHNAEQLVKALKKVWQDPEEAALRANIAYEKFVRNYSSKKMALAYTAVYRQICSSAAYCRE